MIQLLTVGFGVFALSVEFFPPKDGSKKCFTMIQVLKEVGHEPKGFDLNEPIVIMFCFVFDVVATLLEMFSLASAVLPSIRGSYD